MTDLDFVLEHDLSEIRDAMDVSAPLVVLAKTHGVALTKRWALDGRRRELGIRCDFIVLLDGDVVPTLMRATLVVETSHAVYELVKTGRKWRTADVKVKTL